MAKIVSPRNRFTYPAVGGGESRRVIDAVANEENGSFCGFGKLYLIGRRASGGGHRLRKALQEIIDTLHVVVGQACSAS